MDQSKAAYRRSKFGNSIVFARDLHSEGSGAFPGTDTGFGPRNFENTASIRGERLCSRGLHKFCATPLWTGCTWLRN